MADMKPILELMKSSLLWVLSALSAVLFWSDLAYAQAEGGPGPFVQLLPLALVFVVFYFLLIRPQQQKARTHREMIDGLKRNDEVITVGGLYGRVMELNDNIVTLEIAPNVRVRVDRPHIDTVKTVEKAAKGDSAKAAGGADKSERKNK
jgi:preprotein translocase subunit YajC